MRSCSCVLSYDHSLSCTHGRALVFVRFQRIHRSAALFDRAHGPCLPADPDAAGKAIARDGVAGRERVAGDCSAEQSAAARSRLLLRGAGGCGAGED